MNILQFLHTSILFVKNILFNLFKFLISISPVVSILFFKFLIFCLFKSKPVTLNFFENSKANGSPTYPKPSMQIFSLKFMFIQKVIFN